MIIAILAYLGHLAGTLTAKFGFFLQKRLHLQLENSKDSKDSESGESGENQESEKKNKPVYTSLPWLIGFAFIVGGGVFETLMLPYADLVLISTNLIAGIVFNTFLSIRYLDEEFICMYDVAAFACMGIGGMTIVLIANTDKKSTTSEQMKQDLGAGRTIAYFLLSLGVIAATNIYLYFFLKAVGRFENDLQTWAKQ